MGTNNLLFTSFISFCALLHLGDATYEGRRWTYLGDLLQAVDVYSRSPFVMHGRGLQTVFSGYNRGGIWSGSPSTIPQMYIDMREWRDGKNYWSVTAVMTPLDAYPAIIDRRFFGGGLFEDVTLSDGSKYGHWMSGGGNLQTGTFFAVGAPYDPIFYPDANTRLNGSGSVYIYRGEYSEWTNTQKLLANPPEVISYFGDSVAICPKIPTNMVIGSHGDRTDGVFNGGAAYYFTSTPNARFWSEKQKLVPRDKNEEDWFGYRVFIYDEFIAVSKQNDDDQGINMGALYMFRQERAFGLNIWSQQQVIRTPAGRATLFGEFTSIYAHTMAIGSNGEDEVGGTSNTGSLYVYKTYKTMEMPYQKPGPDEELAISSYNNDDDDESSKREPKPKPKPVPMFKWWSQQQKLTARDWHIFRYFGTFSTVYGDGTLIATGAHGEAFTDPIWEFAPGVTEGPNWRSGSAYIFVKDEKYDRWTQQQKFISPAPKKGDYFSDPYLHGSDLIIRNTKKGFVYTDNLNWKCLIVNVWDQFGDGWDTTHLVAYAPGLHTKLTDIYAPTCTSPNPLQFRYCPLMPEDEGMYHFRMEDNVFKSQFWGEARWDIMNEADRTIYYGDAFSSIGFEWDESSLSFTYIPSKDDHLVDNSKCQSCPKPPPKPKPKAPTMSEEEFELSTTEHSASRELKSKSNTQHPTISPAPTLTSTQNVLDPMRVSMASTSLNGWHGYGLEGQTAKNGTGTSWQIYDSYGKKLIYEGTICGLGILSYSCHIDFIPDGKYVFRVGGAKDPFKAEHTWTFCGRYGAVQTMFSFEIKNRQCVPYNSYDATSYCLRKLGMILATSGVIELYGASRVVLTADDFASLETAITRLFSPAHVKKVTVSAALDGISDGGSGTMVQFRAYVDVHSLGFEVANDEDMGEVFEVLSEQLEGAAMSGQLLNEIVAASEEMYGDHHLMDLRGAKLLTLINEGLELFSDSNLESEVENGAVETDKGTVVTDTEDRFVDEVIEVSTDGGYVMLGLLFLLVAGVVWRLSVRTNIRERRPYRAKSNDDLESSISEEALLAESRVSNDDTAISPDRSKRASVAEESVEKSSGSRKSKKKADGVQVMADFAEMLDDLKKMVEIEDEALKPFRMSSPVGPAEESTTGVHISNDGY